jgi:hypothetical protein
MFLLCLQPLTIACACSGRDVLRVAANADNAGTRMWCVRACTTEVYQSQFEGELEHSDSEDDELSVESCV